jgi:2,3,4,5-tetrahydropyridine-2-carboxylate N-succinyltransferase
MSTSQNSHTSHERLAHGHGVATLSGASVLDVWFPAPAMGALTSTPDESLRELAKPDLDRGVTREVVSLEINLDNAPKDAIDAYLRLHLLSHRLVAPHMARALLRASNSLVPS